jgi:L-amino acid N-acyltransferase YncA
MVCDGYEQLYDEYFTWIENDFKTINKDRKRYIFVFHNNLLIGFIRIWNSEHCNKYFNDGILVKKEYRNQGIEYKLLLEGIKEAKNMRAKEIYAQINKNNNSSIKIHKKCGFIEVGIVTMK